MIGSATERPPAHQRAARWWQSRPVPVVTLVLAVALAYTASYSAGFVWDDDMHVTANATIVGPLGLRDIWTSASANYFPLVLTNFWLQHAVAGLNPVVYHAVNVVFHALNAVLLFWVLRRLGAGGAWLGAMVWALHPVQVESVAWISELKNTQSATFYLLAILAYLAALRADKPSRRRAWLAAVLLCAAGAVLSKASTVMLPVALLLCAWWQDKTWRWQRMLPLVPLFALSAAAAGWTIWEQKFHSFALGPEWSQTPAERVVIAGKAVWFYLGKLIWPHPLLFVYPRWEVTANALQLMPAVALAGALLAAWRLRHGRWRGIAFAFAYFVTLLFPVLGFFNVYYFRYSFVADHFQYLASMGPLAALGCFAGSRLPRTRGSLRLAAAAGTAVVVVALGGLTYRETQRFENSESLWVATRAGNAGCWIADAILGNMAMAAGRLDEAMAREQHALRINPAAFEAHYNLGLALVRTGDVAAGIVEYETALRLKPNFPEAEHNLGVALATADRPGDAIPHYQAALRLKPAQPETHLMLALALTLEGRAADATGHYEAALRLKPDYAEAHYAYARTEEERGHTALAAEHYRSAIAARPTYVEARVHLAGLLCRTQQYPAAFEQFEAALKAASRDPEIECEYGDALVAAGRLPEAITHFESALQSNPVFARAHYGLSIALRKSGRYAESAAHRAEAHRLRPDFPP